jgi:hypothetical protein
LGLPKLILRLLLYVILTGLSIFIMVLSDKKEVEGLYVGVVSVVYYGLGFDIYSIGNKFKL